MTWLRSTESVDAGLSGAIHTDHVARRTSAKKSWTEGDNMENKQKNHKLHAD